MARSYHGSILKADVKWQMTSFSVGLNETCNFWEMKKKTFLITMTLMRTIHTKIITSGAKMVSLDKLTSNKIYYIIFQSQTL